MGLIDGLDFFGICAVSLKKIPMNWHYCAYTAFGGQSKSLSNAHVSNYSSFAAKEIVFVHRQKCNVNMGLFLIAAITSSHAEVSSARYI
jgi:hypothetical protein